MVTLKGPVVDKLYLGIDLGTTNSAIARFDGETVTVIPNKRGQSVTPSIVRITNDSVTVGERARKFLHSDPLNTHREFKRLMGTGKTTEPDGCGKQWLPEQLSAEVLKSLLDDAEIGTGLRPTHAVVTVPALFELPQSKATAEAARLAGLEKIELLPEPVASALAAGWTEDAVGQSWLVFDLGGGTFDVSLIEARDGLLRVVGHDGDNFLGGRDIDRRLLDWICQQLSQRHDITLDKHDPALRSVMAALHSEAEQAKIRLSTQPKTSIEIDIEINGEELIDDIELTRAELEVLCQPLIRRALDICQRLLKEHGLSTHDLGKVVLVGGPAHMPIIQERIQQELAPLAANSGDPMTLVAQGAALYAATIDFGSARCDTTAAATGSKFWLQYPTVCSDLEPTVIGRLVESHGPAPKHVVLSLSDGSWQSAPAELSADGVFLLSAQLKPAKANTFTLTYLGAGGSPVDAQPQKISIVHGLTLSDPPLSRSVGVALANGFVKTFIDRGTPLPARRSFVQTTIDTLVPGSGAQLNIPIVQGERTKARFCRKVGNLVIAANALKKPLHAGASIEITIEVDRGGNLDAKALIVDQQVLITGVAQLLIPGADPAALQAQWQSLKRRLTLLQQDAFRSRDETMIRRLSTVQEQLSEVGTDLVQIEHDEDSSQRLHRNLMEMEAEVESLESRGQLELLVEECEGKYFDAAYHVDQWGNEVERKILAETATRFRTAAEQGRMTELERAIEQLERITASAYRRSPDFWADQFSYTAARVHEAKDLKRAQRLVEQGRALLEQGRREELRGITEALWSIMPDVLRTAEHTHDSGVF